MKKILTAVLALAFGLTLAASPAQANVNTYISHPNLGAPKGFGVICYGESVTKWVQIGQDSITKCGTKNLSAFQVSGGTVGKCRPFGTSGPVTTYPAGLYPIPSGFPWNSWECWVNNA